MDILSFLPPLAISFFIGFFLLRAALPGEGRVNPALFVSLAAGLGLGLSGCLAFFHFVFRPAWHAPAVIAANLVLLAGLFCLSLRRNGTLKALFGFRRPDLERPAILREALTLSLIVLAALFFLLYTQVQPYGGWDAWSVWNFKARFLFLEESSWQAMFDPALWRSSPHYPILLPLIIVWGWSFGRNAGPQVPLWVSVIFSAMTAGLLAGALRERIKTLPAVLAALLMVSAPFFVTFATSQYSDIAVAYYLLAAFACFLQGRRDGGRGWFFLSGLCAGLLSFSKNEGALAALLACGLFLCLLVFAAPRQRRSLLPFAAGLFLTGLPTLIFQVFFAPENLTFINGLVSAEHPTGLSRLKVTLAFLLFALKSAQWGGLWILTAGGLLIAGPRALRKGRWIFAAFLFLYLACAVFYYCLNTYFEITWWLRSTVHRVYFTVLPLAVFWCFVSLFRPDGKE